MIAMAGNHARLVLVFAASLAACSSSEPTSGGGGGTSSSGAPDGGVPEDDSRDPTPPSVQLVGRFDTRDPAGPLCAWPGCRIVARFEGTSSISVRLEEIDEPWMEGAPSEWDVAIDGEWRDKLVMTPGEREYVLAEGLTRDTHTIELYKRTEAQNGTTRFLGFDLHGGTLLSPPPRKRRRIEVVGDSAAAGYGVEGVGRGPDCPGPDHAARWQNFRKSFGAVLGEELDAEVAGTVYSGKGLVKNIWRPDEETMPVIFPRANPIDPESTWDFSAFVPHAVLVMIGGNDFDIGQPTDTGPATLAEFTDAYEEFVVTLREKYPEAHVLLVTSPSVSDAAPAGRRTRTNVMKAIESVVARRSAAGDAKVYATTPPAAQPSELTACDAHGSPELHRRVANDLAAILRPKLGW